MKTYTDRGFANYAEFDDVYGAKVTVRQSSLATDDCVWIFTKGGTDDNDGAIHLNVEKTVQLIAALSEWLAETTAPDTKRDSENRV
jgi:hypothetical protein